MTPRLPGAGGEFVGGVVDNLIATDPSSTSAYASFSRGQKRRLDRKRLMNSN